MHKDELREEGIGDNISLKDCRDFSFHKYIYTPNTLFKQNISQMFKNVDNNIYTGHNIDQTNRLDTQ